LETYRPRFQPQLGRGTPHPAGTRGDTDCALRSEQMGIDQRTHGQKVPSVRDLRRRMDKPGPQPTSIADAHRAVTSYRRIRGRHPMRYLLRWSTETMRAAISRGRYVQIAVDYGTFNRVMFRTGDPNYTGGHSVLIGGQRQRHGDIWWLLWDSLDDRRRVGIPHGPRWVRAWKVVAAAEAFAGGPGRVQAGVFLGGGKK
jgi:hypothetical protein